MAPFIARKISSALGLAPLGLSIALVAASGVSIAGGDARAQRAPAAGAAAAETLPARPRPAPNQPRLLNRAPGGDVDVPDTLANSDVPSPIPADDVSRIPDEADDLDPKPANGQRAVRLDGDLSDPEPPQLRDGIVDVAEPAVPVDGVDPTVIDTRDRNEAQLFENAPPPEDPLLFQIEELDPILDRRPRRLFRFEPYDPVGIKVGSFVLFPELEASAVGFSNVFRSVRARSDVAFDVRPSARLVSNWSRHALEFRANGLMTFFNEFPSEDDRAYTLEARGRIDVSKRTNIQVGLSRDLAQESRSAPDGRAGGPRADVQNDRVIATLNHRFNRLSLQLRGSLTDTSYGSTTDSGVIVDNGVRDYRTAEQAVRATWEFKPTLAAFGEVAVNQRDYGRRDFNGFDRSSDGERYRVGLSFAGGRSFAPTDRPTVPLWAGEFSIGYGEQRPRDGRLPDVSGVILDSTVVWRPTALTSLAFNARSDFGETQTAGVGGIKSQTFGVDVRHELRRHLVGTAGVNTTFADYEGSPLSEVETRLATGLEYFLSPEAIVFGKYQHTIFDSNAANASYTNDEVRVGVRIRR